MAALEELIYATKVIASSSNMRGHLVANTKENSLYNLRKGPHLCKCLHWVYHVPEQILYALL